MKRKCIFKAAAAAAAVAAVLAAMCIICVFAGCSSESGGASAKYVTGISIECGDALTLNFSQEARMTAVVETSFGSYDGNIEWTSSDEDVAYFRVGGVLVTSGFGETTVTAFVPGTEFSDECLVTVTGDTLRVGVKDDVVDFGYLNEEGEYEGMEIELARMLKEELGYEKIEFVPVTADNREDMLTYNYVDCVVATYSRTDDRAQVVDFSTPYYTDYVQVLASEKYFEEGIESLSDVYKYVCGNAGAELDENGEIIFDGEDYVLTSCRVAYEAGSTAATAFDDYCAETDGLYTETPIGDIFEFVPCEDYQACEDALESGDVDLFIADRSILRSYMTDKDYVLSDKLEEQEYCVGTARKAEGDDNIFDTIDLSSEIDRLINEWLRDGAIDVLIAKYGLEA